MREGIQIVIDIPDGCYDELNNGQFPIQDAYRLVAWIKEGTVLPKGHGKLIDSDVLWNAFQDLGQDFYEAFDFVETNAIIEADKDGE